MPKPIQQMQERALFGVGISNSINFIINNLLSFIFITLIFSFYYTLIYLFETIQYFANPSPEFASPTPTRKELHTYGDPYGTILSLFLFFALILTSESRSSH